MSNDKIRNPKAFIKAYLGSETGKRVLNRTPFRDKKTGNHVWQSSAMASAFAASIGIEPAVQQPAEHTPKQMREMMQASPASTFLDAEGEKQLVPDMMKKQRGR